jgi:hypothetical protein
MAIYYFTGTTSGLWTVTTNWMPNGTPGAGDTIILDGRMARALTGSPAGSPLLAAILHYMSAGHAVGTADAPIAVAATNVYLGLPSTDGSSGSGAGVSLNFGTNTGVIVHAMESGTSGTSSLPPYLLQGTGSGGFVLNVDNARVGVGIINLEASTVSTATLSGRGRLQIGQNVTLTTLNTGDRGGEVVLSCAATTVNQNSGIVTTEGSGAIATNNIRGGTCYANSTGTTTAANISGTGTLSLERSPAARTFITVNLYGASARLSDPLGVGIYTDPIDCEQGARTTQVDGGLKRSITLGAAS